MKKFNFLFLLLLAGCAAPAMLALNAASFALQTADVVHHWDDGEALADFIGVTQKSVEPPIVLETVTVQSKKPHNPYYCASPNYVDLTCNDK